MRVTIVRDKHIPFLRGAFATRAAHDGDDWVVCPVLAIPMDDPVKGGIEVVGIRHESDKFQLAGLGSKLSFRRTVKAMINSNHGKGYRE